MNGNSKGARWIREQKVMKRNLMKLQERDTLALEKIASLLEKIYNSM